ncbi:hypothetical protein [Flagellimonas allohymeniacidonis]|uniref:Lipoprotein n=1 Tax=Flagellimonas allohymeniacidonis TaxID=2517819 RepID=A0A4V2HSL2_9FLAO|nr:hypothetical protein [Allomuricauda hymeniacidonis]TAI48150.1 hypothetical protein EW142_16020 [Allomuricauda hymeniacidonis]
MRKTNLFFVTLLGVIALSCNFTEEITLQEDGSGKLSINFDGSELMEMAGEEMMKDNEKPVDSLISFKDILEEKKDSIAQLSPEEQEKLKRLEPFNMHMVMNPEEKLMKFDLFSEFTNVSEVNDAFNAFQGASALGPNGGQEQPSPMGGQDPTTEVSYSFEGNKFSRQAKIIDEELFKQSIDSLQGAEMFLSGSTYTLKYHFPKRVKSTSAEAATFSADGKTLIYQVKFLDLMKDPSILDLEVELED